MFTLAKKIQASSNNIVYNVPSMFVWMILTFKLIIRLSRAVDKAGYLLKQPSSHTYKHELMSSSLEKMKRFNNFQFRFYFVPGFHIK